MQCNSLIGRLELANTLVGYKPRVAGKPSTSHKNVGFLNLNAQQIHTAQKNEFIAKAGRERKCLCFTAVSKIKKGTSKQKIYK